MKRQFFSILPLLLVFWTSCLHASATSLELLKYEEFYSFPSAYCENFAAQYSDSDKLKAIAGLQSLSKSTGLTTDVLKRGLKNQILKSFRSLANKDSIVAQAILDKTQADFVKLAEDVFPDLGKDSVRRAKGNIWPIYVFHRLFLNDMHVEVQPNAVFGFSMLYPFTDDVIDDINLTKEEKRHFVQAFGRKIGEGGRSYQLDASLYAARDGTLDEALARKYARIWNMFDLIETQFPRHRAVYQDLYESFLYLHRGQIDSQKQQLLPLGSLPPEEGTLAMSTYAKDIFEITMRKGAGSLLSDAYLVKADLNAAEKNFAGHLGSITQLLNDMSSIIEDISEEGHFTPLNLAYLAGIRANRLSAEQQKAIFDDAVNRVFYYVKAVFANNKRLLPGYAKAYLKEVKNYLIIKLLMQVGKNAHLHTSKFVAHMMAYSPFSATSLRLLNDLQEVGKSKEELAITLQELKVAMKVEFKVLLAKQNWLRTYLINRRLNNAAGCSCF